jgi:hypothetical protein
MGWGSNTNMLAARSVGRGGRNLSVRTQALAQQQSLKAQCSESAYKPQSGGSVREMRKVSSGAMTE